MPDDQWGPSQPPSLTRMTTWQPHVVSIEGRFVSASNATLLGVTQDGDRVVYKPVAGERPLWDFEFETLAVREVLTYELSELLGMGVVPETALGDGIYGPGSVQRFVEHDTQFDALDLVRREDGRLWPIAVLDVIANNADRKLGHILLGVDGELKAIDHGLTFHADDKLRSVLWVFAGQMIPAPLLSKLDEAQTAVDGSWGRRIVELLGAQERAALRARTRLVLDAGVHPDPPTDRPAIPWPAY